MLAKFVSDNFTDSQDNPAGGYASGPGMDIIWQDGPLGREPDRAEPNGAFVETVIAAAQQRIKWYQEVSGGRFKCPENEQAILCLYEALRYLDSRTEEREARGVEGTHQQ